MRCFTYDAGKFVPGFRFQTVDGITIGGRSISFDESLVFSPDSHFGQYIIRASVVKGVDKISLSAESAGEEGALLRVIVPVHKASEITGRRRAGVCEEVFAGRSSQVRYHGRNRKFVQTWETLIRFSGPGEFRIAENVVREPTRVEKFVGIDPTDSGVRTYTFSFDGERFSVSLDEPEGTAPKSVEHQYGMYDEGNTVELIAEMIGNQDRLYSRR